MCERRRRESSIKTSCIFLPYRAVAFIERQRARPFLLYLAYSMPHVPLFVGPRYRGVSKQGLYGDVIMEIDWSVGQILAALEKHKLADNTLVIFTSDNGPWLVRGEHGGSALPLRAGKGTTYEGGLRVPCVMRWKGRIPAGKVCDELATTMDILPTFAKLAGAKVPDDRVLDGRDAWPLLSGRSSHARFLLASAFTRRPLPAARAANPAATARPPPQRRGISALPSGTSGASGS